MAGKLYLCATPIGNLEDITYRVLRTLKEVDLIAAEDTRNSIKLLNHFEIKTPMTSYHEYNKIEKAYQLVDKLREGKNIALITDAGTPGISDPGEDLVRICYEEGIEVTSLPGAAACITALTMSGLPTRRFAFEAFLPRDKKERAAPSIPCIRQSSSSSGRSNRMNGRISRWNCGCSPSRSIHIFFTIHWNVLIWKSTIIIMILPPRCCQTSAATSASAYLTETASI